MRRLLPILLILAAGALAGAGGTSAATLYTTSAHTTTVTVGAVASLTTTAGLGMFSGATQIGSCSNSTLGFKIDQNSGGVVTGTFNSGTFTGCATATQGNFIVPWRLTIRGSGAASGTNTVFTRTTVDSLSFTMLGGTYTGTLTDATATAPPTHGVFMTQPTAAGAPLCVALSTAGTYSGPLTSVGTLTGTYCFEAAPATAWSLGN